MEQQQQHQQDITDTDAIGPGIESGTTMNGNNDGSSSTMMGDNIGATTTTSTSTVIPPSSSSNANGIDNNGVTSIKTTNDNQHTSTSTGDNGNASNSEWLDYVIMQMKNVLMRPFIQGVAQGFFQTGIPLYRKNKAEAKGVAAY